MTPLAIVVGLPLLLALAQADVKHILPQSNEADQNLNAISQDAPVGNCCNQQYQSKSAGFATGATYSGSFSGGQQAQHSAFTSIQPGSQNTQFTPNDLAFWWLGKDSPFLQAYEYFKTCTEKGNCALPAPNPGSLPPRQGCNANGCSSSGSFNVNEQASGGQKTGPFNPANNPFLNGDFQGIAISSENGKPITTITTCKGPNCQTSSINGLPNTPLDISANPFLNGAIPNTQGAALAGAGSSPPGSSSPNPFVPQNNPFFVHGGGNGLPPCVHGPQGSFYPGQNGQGGQFVPNPDFQGPSVIAQGGAQEPEKTDFSNNPFLSGSGSSGSSSSGFAQPQVPAKAICQGNGAICVSQRDCFNGLVAKHAEGVYQIRAEIQYCDTNNGEVCCKLPKKQPQNVFIQGNSANSGFVSGNGDKSSVNFGDITGVIPGQNTIKIPGGPGISPGVIHVVPDAAGAASTVAPSISNYGQSGSFNLRPANPSGFISAASTISPNSVAVSNGNPFSSTIDYNNVQFSASEINQAAAAAQFQGPAYLPPDLPTPPPTPYRPPSTYPTTPYRPPTTHPTTPYRPPTTYPTTPYRPPSTYPTTPYRPPVTYTTTTYRPPTTHPTTPYRPPNTYPTTPRTTQYTYTSSVPVNIFTNPPTPQGGYSYPTPTPTFNPYQPEPAGNINQYATPTKKPQGYTYNTPTPAFTFPTTPRTTRPPPPPLPPRINNEYLPPDSSSIHNIYNQQSTPKPFVPPPPPTTTYRPYVPPVTEPPRTTPRYVPPPTTTYKPYVPPPTTTYKPYVPPSTTQRPYVPPQTTQRPYVPPQTTQRPYVPPSTTYKPYVPTTTYRPYVPPVTTQRPYVPPQTTQRPYVPSVVTKRPFVPSTYLPPQPPSPDYDGAGNSINGQFVGFPTQAPAYLPPAPPKTTQRPLPPPTPYDPDRYGEGDSNAGQAIGFPRPTQQPQPRPRPIQPVQPQDPGLPYAGCAAALVCVQEIYCSAEGVISKTPVVLTKDQELNRVPLTECQDKQGGIIGKCCRDPNYVDPWPSTKLDKNGFDDGQYREDDSISQYQPSKNLQGAATNRYRKRENPPNQIAASYNPQPQGQQPQVNPYNNQTDTNAQQPQGPFYSHISNPSCGQRHANTNPRGTGPNEVNFAEITWQAMILRESNRSLLCGGAIIRMDAVLTAAHCVEGMDSSDVLIKGGEWKLGIDEEPQPFQIVKVAAIIRHPQYSNGNKQYDLVVLKLAEKLRPAKNVGTICLGRIGQPVLDENCIATGWGKRILQLHLQGAIMRSVDVNLLSNQECAAKLQQTPQILQDYSQRYLCGQSQSNQCDIDIGSALACRGSDGRYSLSGILTWDTGCRNPDQIGGYLAPDTTWIESTLSRQINDLRNEERQYNSRLQS